MPNEPSGHHATLLQLAARDADAAQIADAAIAIWHRIEAALSPIVGRGGVAALYRRSLHLARARHACLALAQEGAAGGYESLRTALARQTTTEAAAAHGELLQSFVDLSVSLIGAALTARLLAPVWDDQPRNGDPKQDHTPP